MNTIPKKISIRPFNSDMEIRFRAVNCLNDFHVLGFIKPNMLHELLVEKDVLKSSDKGIVARFWALNYYDETFISKLENIIEDIKKEFNE